RALSSSQPPFEWNGRTHYTMKLRQLVNDAAPGARGGCPATVAGVGSGRLEWRGDDVNAHQEAPWTERGRRRLAGHRDPATDRERAARLWPHPARCLSLPHPRRGRRMDDAPDRGESRAPRLQDVLDLCA